MNPPWPANDGWLAADRALSLLALVVAAEAGAGNEIPVGAILSDSMGTILAAAGNRSVAEPDPAGHAEMRAMRLGALRTDNFRLTRAQLTVSLEPCPMCLAAASMARLERLQYVAWRDTQHDNARVTNLCHPPDPQHALASATILRLFFAPKRESLNPEPDSALMTQSNGGDFLSAPDSCLAGTER